MKERIVKRRSQEAAGADIHDRETGQLLYSLDLQEEGLWKKTYTVKTADGAPAGTIRYQHEAFRLAKMPVIRGYLGEKEVFCLRREIEALRDGITAEGEGLTVKGNLLEGNFKLCHQDACIAAFRKEKDGEVLAVEGEEPLAVLFAFALECF